jgi:hypothetical protein
MKILICLFFSISITSLFAQEGNKNLESCLSMVESYSQSQAISYISEEVEAACSNVNNSGSLSCISQNIRESIDQTKSINLYSVITKCAINSSYRINRFAPRG